MPARGNLPVTQRLAVFFFLTGWAYLALALVRRDGWASVGRAAQFALFAAATGLLLGFWGRAQAAVAALRAWSGAGTVGLWEWWWPAEVGGVFFLITLGPVALYRRAERHAAHGRRAAAGRLRRAARVLAWHWVPKGERETMRARLLMQQGMAEDARDLSSRLLSRTSSGPARQKRAAVKIEAHAVLHEWAQARQTFEQEFSIEERDAAPGVLYAAVRAFLETGDPARGLACLEAAEAQREVASAPDLQRFMAFVAAYALTGNVPLLRDLVYEPRSPAWSMPAAFRPYWMGVGYAASGQAARARIYLDAAASRTDEFDDDWRQAIAARLEALDRSEGLAAPASRAEVDVAALPELWVRRAPVSPLTYGVGMAPATIGLVGVTIAIWVLTEAWPVAGQGDRLILFGANVPAWVRRGEVWRLGAGLFLHAGILHLAFNMYAVYLFGSFLERIVGWAPVLSAYGLAGLGGAASTAFLSPYSVSVGASGAALGLLGAAGVLTLRERRLFPKRLRGLYLVNFGFVACGSVVFGWLTPEIDNYAHAGGLCVGALLGFAAAPAARIGPWRRWAGRAVAAALSVLFLVWAAEAAANVKQGGYPRRVAAVRTWREQALGLRIEVPEIWDRDSAPDRVYFFNSLDTQQPHYQDVLEVSVASEAAGQLGPDAPDRGPAIERSQSVGSGPTRETVVLAYRRLVGARQVRFRFVCDRRALDARWGLYGRIVASAQTLAGGRP